MKSKVFGSLFALPFAAVGIWMLYSVAAILYDATEMRDWQPVPATLIDAGFETHQGDDSDTYEAYARYTYTYAGGSYTADRVAIARGADNIGSYQRDLGRRLAAALARGEPVTAWVDPAAPEHAVIDRTLRWGLIGFKCIFLIVFGGVGFGLLFVIWRAPEEKDASLPVYQASPWLLNDRWKSASIRSDSRRAMWGAWAFAALWNLISAPLPFLIYEEFVTNGNRLALLGLLFPLVGLGLLVWALRRTREWRRFGATPVLLDPFPGSIGGHVGGTIETRLPYSASNRFTVTLTNIHSYVSGSGDSRSRRERALWQDDMTALAEPGTHGTRLAFRFDVPQGLAESDVEQSDDSHNLWRLNVRARLPDADLDRDFDIPVYATGTRSVHLDDRRFRAVRAETDAAREQAVRNRVRVRLDGVGKTLVYPMGQNASSNIAGILIGGLFAGAGGYLIVHEEMPLFGGIFATVGGLIALAALYMLFRSLEIRQQGDTIISIRRWLELPVARRELRKPDFQRFEKQSSMQAQTGGKHVVYYKVVAVGRNAGKVLVGDGFRGESEADAAIRFLARELGLRGNTDAPRRPSDALEEELVNEF